MFRDLGLGRENGSLVWEADIATEVIRYYWCHVKHARSLAAFCPSLLSRVVWFPLVLCQLTAYTKHYEHYSERNKVGTCSEWIRGNTCSGQWCDIRQNKSAAVEMRQKIQNEKEWNFFPTPKGPKLQSNCLDKCYKNAQNAIINSTQDHILVKYVKIN